MRELRVALVSPAPPPYGGISNWTRLIQSEAQRHPDIDLRLVDTAQRWRAIGDLRIWLRVVTGGTQLNKHLLQIIYLLLAWKPDVLHLCSTAGLALIRDLVVLSMCKLRNIRSLYHLRFGQIPKILSSGGLEGQLIMACIRRATVTLVLDQFTIESIRRKMPGCSILKFPNCVDIASMAYQEPTLDNEPQLIYVGHILPSKGLRELMEACNRFPDDLKWRLKIIGPGSNIAFKEELQDKLTHKTRKRVEFLGELSHGMTMQLLSQSDILVLPSYSEGFPNVILEAMAAGKAILATEVGAIPEMIQGEKGACGLCVPPREVGPLAESLELLLRDKQLRVSMGRAGRLHAEKSFALPVVFSRLKGLWNLGGQKNYVQE